MKRVFPFVLVLIMALSFSIPVYAEELPPDETTIETESDVSSDTADNPAEDAVIQNPEQENVVADSPSIVSEADSSTNDTSDQPVEVMNFEELVTAINEAQDGSVIKIKEAIYIWESCTLGSLDKHITLVCDESISVYMLEISIRSGSVTMNGITFDGNDAVNSLGLILVNNGQCTFNGCDFINSKQALKTFLYGEAAFVGCKFSGNNNVLSIGNDRVSLSECQFLNNSGTGTGISLTGNATIENCIFENNNYISELSGSGLLYLWPSANITLTNCAFISNRNTDTGGGAIACEGQAILTNCYFEANSSNIGGNDIGCWGTGKITITNTDEEMTGIYGSRNREFLGAYQDNPDVRYNVEEPTEKINLPVSEYTGAICFASNEIVSTPPETEPDEEVDNETTPPDDTTQQPETQPDVDNTQPPDEQRPTDESDNQESDEPEESENIRVDRQESVQYIYYIPQTPATENTEPTATEESTVEATQGVAEQYNPYTGDEMGTMPMSTPEALEMPQERAGDLEEVSTTLKDLCGLLIVLIVVQAIEIACIVVIWATPRIKRGYEGQYKH